MMSVRHLKDNRKKTSTLFSPREEHSNLSRLDRAPQPIHPPQKLSISSLDSSIDLSLVLAPPPAIDYAKIMQASRDAFQQHLQLPMDTSTRHKLIHGMEVALIACFKSMSLDAGVAESKKTLDFILQYPPEKLVLYPPIAETPYANALAVVIACELSSFFNLVAWTYFHVLFRNKKFQCNDILQNLLVSTIHFASAHLDLALAYIELFDINQPFSFGPSTMSGDDIEFSIKEAERCVHEFYRHVLYCNFRENRVLFELDRVLFLAFTTHAKLALKQNKLEEAAEFINKADVFIHKYRHTKYYKTNKDIPSPLLSLQALKFALKTQKNKAKLAAIELKDEQEIPSEDVLQASASTTPDVITENTPEKISDEKDVVNAIDTNNQRLIGRKRLKQRKKEAHEIRRLPKCYEANPHLRTLLEQYSGVFITCGIDGYVFGSSHYKKNPGDFDILIPNISTNAGKERLMQLIRMIESQGGVALRDKTTGELGYKKPNRHVIPITWQGWKTDLIIEAGDFIEHAKRLDYTIGALYFSLRTKKTYCMKGFSSLTDLDDKILRTIDDPYESFKRDPSLIFRGIRLCALEDFTFSPECLAAMRTLFVEEKNNIFISSMNYGKLCQQLNLMFSTPEETIILDKFKELNLLPKLSQSIHELPEKSRNSYVVSLMQYKSSPKHRVCNPSFEQASVSKLGLYSATSPEKGIKRPSSKKVTAPVSTL
ncbi:MAG: hypothetical protein P1U36_07205 [Legionellaceae bacterium]|nr:hypothetical protein [Legionellaceae bacterium]